MANSEKKNSKPPPWQDDHDVESIPFGAWLRRQRELREISLREIADTTKISIRYLQALEQDRFDVLPAPVFAKGFLREYARFVGLDPDEVVNSYLNAQVAYETGEVPTSEEESSPAGPNAGEWLSSAILVVGVILLLLAVAFVAFHAERSRSEIEPPPMAAPVVEETEALALETTAEMAPTAPLLVTMDFKQDCWVEAVADDSVRISELHVQGESLQIPAERRVVLLTVGDPAAVNIEVNGVPFEIPGAEAGRVARDVEITLPEEAAPSDES